MSDFFWRHSYCLGLSKKIFGNEAAYIESDMQFARQTAEAFAKWAVLLDKTGDGKLDPRLSLDLHA